MITIRDLLVYPVKSCRGSQLTTATVGTRGIEHDREWMFVDHEGVFLTQRELPRLALVEAYLTSDALTLRAPGIEPLLIPLDLDGPRTPVAIWKSVCLAVDQGPRAVEWLGELLGVAGRLVRLAPEHVRAVHRNYTRFRGEQVGLADGYPFLLIAEESLADLNSRMAAPLPMNRFRPNIVVAGAAAFAEDDWGEFTAGDVRFAVAKPCSRCAITQTDQETAARSREPLATLARYRLAGKDMLFGVNLVHANTGRISVGDELRLS